MKHMIIPPLRKLLRTSIAILLLGVSFSPRVFAEGTRQLAPTPQDSLVMLEVGRDGFGNFAIYNGPEDSRLFVTIKNPSEIVYLGFSGEHQPNGAIYDLSRSNYEFRIRKLGGTTPVHGPFVINNDNANVKSWTQAQYGNYDVTTTDVNGALIYQFAPGEAGDYIIEFRDLFSDGTAQVNIGFWDITVTLDGTPILGRVWSRNWAFRTPAVSERSTPECQWNREFNGTLYSYTTDGFVSRINFTNSGLQGLSFNVAFNSTGPGSSDDLVLSRQSVVGQNETIRAAEHQIFLNEPDPLSFPDGECGSIIGASEFTCTRDGFCLEVTVSKPGQVEVYLDFDQNGQFDPNSMDVNLIYNFGPNELSACIPWNGLKGDSTSVAFGDRVDIIFAYSQGVQHWAVFDVEYLKNGFCVESIRPQCDGGIVTDRLYWDDTKITDDPGTGQPKSGLNGCSCESAGCRTWNNFDVNLTTDDCTDVLDELTMGYGDKNTLNTWWFANVIIVTQADIPILSCQITGDTTICGNGSTVLEVATAGTVGETTYTWRGPNGFLSDQSSSGPILSAGEYCVTITDEQGCELVCCQQVVERTGPELSVNKQDATCEAANDGSIQASATGGEGTNYEFSLNGGPFQASGLFENLGVGTYTLSVMDGIGCTTTQTVEINTTLDIDLVYPDTLFLCFGQSQQVSLTGDPAGFDFSWTPTDGLDDPSAAQPVFSTTNTTTYTVKISSQAAPECFEERTLVVFVHPDIALTIEGEALNGTTCEPTTTFSATTAVSANITWKDDSGNTLGEGETLTIPVSGTTTIVVTAVDENGCVDTETITVSGGPVEVSLADTVAVCLGEQLIVAVTNLDPNDILTYTWTPVDAFAAGADSANPDVIESVGRRTLFVTIENQFGCTYTDSVHTAVLDPNLTVSFTTELQCNGATVLFTNTSTNAFGFSWDFGDGTTLISDEATVSHNYGSVGTFNVSLGLIYDVSCAASFTASVVTMEPELAAAFSYDIIACSPDSASIAFFDESLNSFGNDLTYLWTFNNGQTSTAENPIISVVGSGDLTATLKVTSANDCEDEITETIDIQLVAIDLQDTLTLCKGGSVNLNPNGNPGYIYSWSPALGLDATNVANPLASPQQTTLYTVTVLNIAGGDTCSVTDQITVFVPADINLDLGDDIITCGEDVTLTPQTDTEVTISWSSALDGPLPSGPSITVNPFRRDTIFALATDAFGCMDRDTIVIIDQGVDVTTDPAGSLTVCAGLETNISVINLDAEDNLTISWSPTANIVAGANEATATVVVSEQEGSVTFTAIVGNQFACSDTVTVTINVVPFNPTVADTIFACFDIPTPINPGFTEVYTYQWSPAAQLDDANADNPMFTGTATQTYQVTITDQSNGLLCETTEEVVVFVYPNIDLQTTGDTALCEIVEATLTANTAVSALIEWYDDAGLSNKIGEGSPLTVTPALGTNTYTAIATATESGCTDTSQVVITINDITSNMPDTLIRVCANLPTELNPNGNSGLVYDWNPTTDLDLSTNGPHNPIITTTGDIVFTLTVTDPQTGCQLKQTVHVIAYPAINLETTGDTMVCEPVELVLAGTTDIATLIQWYNNPSLNTPFAQGSPINVIPPQGTTIYTAIATDAMSGCTDTSQVIVTVNDITEALPDTAYAICPNAPFELNPNGNPQLIYEWNPSTGLDLNTNGPHNPIITTNVDVDYELTVTDPATGCMLSQMVKVTVFPAINLVTTGDTLACEPTDLVMTATSDIANVNFEWFDNPGMTGTPFATGGAVAVSPEGEITYYVKATDENGCTETGTVAVRRLPVNATITPALVFCEPVDSAAILVTNLSPNQTLTYEWIPAEAGHPQGSDMAMIDPNVLQEVSVIVTNQLGCSTTLTTTAVVIDLENTLTITADPDTILLDEFSTLTVAGCDGCTYEWFPPSGEVTPNNEAVVIATPDEPGSNIYTVTVSQLGCTRDLTVEVFVIPFSCDPEHVFLPNTFTPNGDNKNDDLRLRSVVEIEEMELMIYTRWGEEVFRTQSFIEASKGWDGTYKGKELPPDVYGFWLKVICPGGQELIRQGNITLLR
ncbi:MAG: gliding motility-associated C-terminal domain-containing protein [Saprospiraceae bacterium]